MEVVKELKIDQKLPQAEVFLEAENILRSAAERKVILRLLGGVGVWFVAPSASKVSFARTYNDIDFVGLKKQSHKIEELFSDMGYKPREMFNKLQGDTRLMFTNGQNGRRIDIFLDKFVMCHEFNLKDRLELSEKSLPPADLLLTKLQVVEITKKDILDAAALLLDLPISDKPSEIEKKRILYYTSVDWGIYKTVTINLEKIKTILTDLALPEKETRIILERIDELIKAIEESPKTLGWKMRAKVGEKVKWYELPEPT
ncbi:MAG: hypothetical protein ACYCPW_06930 [Nitrososphaerales archaeon]